MMKNLFLFFMVAFASNVLAREKKFSLSGSIDGSNRSSASLLYRTEDKMDIGLFVGNESKENKVDERYLSAGVQIGSESKITDIHSFVLGFAVGSAKRGSNQGLLASPSTELRINFGELAYLGSGVSYVSYGNSRIAQSGVTSTFNLGTFF